MKVATRNSSDVVELAEKRSVVGLPSNSNAFKARYWTPHFLFVNVPLGIKMLMGLLFYHSPLPTL